VERVHPLERIRIFGLAEKLAAVEKHLFAPPLFPIKPPWPLVPLEEEVALEDSGRLRFFPLMHQGGSIGFRLDWPGHSMAYVTDTTAKPDAPYIKEIRGVDLLVHECYFADAQAAWAEKTGHSHTSAVARLARQAGVGRLVLVHINPLSLDADPIGLGVARAIFPSTELGEDLMEVEF
jgi:ribonuclease BN (tRNA processing enzyme)